MSTDISPPRPPPPAATVSLSAMAEDAPNAPLTSAASETPTDKPAASESKVTGLTPDQVLQELQKSGYVDQLRRKLFDAFASSAAASTAAVTGAESTPAAATSASSGVSAAPAASAIDAAPAPPISTSTPSAPIKISVTETPSETTATTPVDAPHNIATKSSFLTFLSQPLRHAVEKDHSNLRLLETREQEASLLKALESDTVEHPDRDTLGEATIYDLLVRQLVSAPGAAVLAREGQVGTEAWARVGEVLDEMLNPAAKDEEGEEDDDDDDEEGEEGENARTEIEAKPSEEAASLTTGSSQQAVAMDQD